MKKLRYILIAVLAVITVVSCKKEAGEGGKASIKGAIRVKKYNSSGTVIAGEYEGAYEDVYIIYGDNSTYGNKIQANPEGKYEFKYLQTGHYKVYAYSKDSTGNSTAPKFALIRDVEISSRKETVDAGTITVYAY